MKKFFLKVHIIFLITFLYSSTAFSWGFFAHKNINRLAVFTLPPEMMGFYKKNIAFLEETAVLPDKRRYAVKDEAPRHFIDLDVYEDSAGIHLPFSWKDAVNQYTEDSLMRHGILPWHLSIMKFRLTEAFRIKDAGKILKLSSEMGHYISDGNVPLHTCRNYNGQLTNQHGIHGFWESRLPELYFSTYDFFVGPAEYIENTSDAFWKMVFRTHVAVDSVLKFEKLLSDQFSQDKKYAFEERGGVMVKVYSKEFSFAYHKMLDGQVERQIRASVKMVGNIWYTCWVDAGQPDLGDLYDHPILDEEDKDKEQKIGNEVTHENCNH